MGRMYLDPPAKLRCQATITLRDGSKAQCGRRRKVGGLCTQHDAMKTERLAVALGVELLGEAMRRDRHLASRGG